MANWSGRPEYRPSNWSSLRKRVLARDPWCTRCGVNPSTDVDHILNVRSGGSHHLDNLTGLCHACHQIKSSQEARAALTAKRNRGKRPVEPHPGLIRGS